MSIIAVKGFPNKCDLRMVIKTVAKTINGNFEALNFQVAQKSRMKTCFLRLSPKLDPVRIIEKINGSSFRKMSLHAFIPDHVPDFPLATKPRKIPEKLRRALKIQEEQPPKKVFSTSYKEIMTELQAKYSGLYALSNKTGHQLLAQLSRIVFERLKTLYQRGSDPCVSAFHFTSCYRRAHPHFGDFQLVLTTLHGLEDAAGNPRTQLKEAELTAVAATPCTIDNMPFDEVQKASNKYSERINKKLMEHIENLDANISTSDPEEITARKKVRQELKKMAPYLPLIVKQVIRKHLIPEKGPFHRVRVYGEPFLPNKDLMGPFVRRYGAVHIQRSSRMYNLLVFNVPPQQFASVRAMDGTVVSGAKLVIRSSDMPLYKESQWFWTEMASLFGGPVEEGFE